MRCRQPARCCSACGRVGAGSVLKHCSFEGVRQAPSATLVPDARQRRTLERCEPDPYRPVSLGP
jgi:hypothetical protein